MNYTYTLSDVVDVNFVNVIVAYIPRFLAAVLVFFLGIIVANLVKKIVVKITESLKFGKLAEGTDFEKFLEKAEIRTKIEHIIGNVFKWLTILLFVVTAINILGIPTISEVLNNVISYIPSVISAVFVLTIGIFLAGIVEKFVKGAVAQFDQKTGRLIGKIASYIMMIFAIMAAINELGIAEELINILFMGLVATLSLGIGLAIGLGGKDLVSEIMMSWYKKLKTEVKK
jgi:small-conductance mechanosensitive channel